MSWVSLEVAIGTITLDLIPALSPSIAKVLLKPTNPNLAELQKKKSRYSKHGCQSINSRLEMQVLDKKFEMDA